MKKATEEFCLDRRKENNIFRLAQFWEMALDDTHTMCRGKGFNLGIARPDVMNKFESSVATIMALCLKVVM